jgi:hypothetical protein
MVFAIGVFAVGLSVVFATTGGYFTGGMVQGGDTTSTADALTVEVATSLEESRAKTGQQPALNSTAVEAFFSGGEDPEDQLSVPDGVAVNVSLRAANGTSPPQTFAEVSGDKNATALMIGPQPRIGSSTGERMVILDGTLVVLEVQVWPDG